MGTPSRSWKGHPVTNSNYVKDDGELETLDAAHFCAAGALLWHAREGSEPRVLLAVEDRPSPSKLLTTRYNFLGGKRDAWNETARAVAARECWEETGELLSAAARAQMEHAAQPVAWHGRSKYALFVHELYAEDADLAERVAAINGGPNPVHDPHLRGCAWEPLACLLNDGWCVKQLHRFAVEQARAVRPLVRRLLQGGRGDTDGGGLHAFPAWEQGEEPTMEHAVEHAVEHAAELLTSLSLSRDHPGSIPPPPFLPCGECGCRGLGRVDTADGCFYCGACWAEYQGKVWPVLGGKSERFKQLTSGFELFTFGCLGGHAHPRFGRQRIELLEPGGAEGAEALCAELRRDGQLNGRTVLGFDTETKPAFTAGVRQLASNPRGVSWHGSGRPRQLASNRRGRQLAWKRKAASAGIEPEGASAGMEAEGRVSWRRTGGGVSWHRTCGPYGHPAGCAL
jgi:8-oxo-dGTP pyrophosphatase MutT (NUDIX family)